MAGLEVVVRPVVFPNIRPGPPRVLAHADDPTQGFAVITGSGGRLIDLPRTWSVSTSYGQPHKEAVRQFDVEKVYQVDEGGNINRDNFVKLERLKRVRMDTEDAPPYKMLYADPPSAENVETVETNVTRRSSP